MSKRSRAPKALIVTVGIMLGSAGGASRAQLCVVRERQQLKASDAAAYDFFAKAVSISGEWAIIGAPKDDGAAADSGAAYVFRRDDNGTPLDPSDVRWIEHAKLAGSDAAFDDQFGLAVAINGDRAIVGAPWVRYGLPRPGSAYVFRRDDNGTPAEPSDDTWIEEARLAASDANDGDWFGVSISISGDRAIVGASRDIYLGSGYGSAYVFRHDDNDTPFYPGDDSWVEEGKLTASDAAEGDWFAVSVSISGDRAIVGAAYSEFTGKSSGSAHVFRRDDNNTPSNPSDDSWIEESALRASDGHADAYFGFSVSISGDRAIVGALWDDEAGSRSGSAYTFRRDDNGTPSVSSDDSWLEVQKLIGLDTAAKDNFGNSVSISDRWAVVGAYFDDDACQFGSTCDSGSAYVYRCEDNGTPSDPSDDVWVHQAKYTASDAAEGDALGRSVSISGDTAVVGAPLVDTSGAAYIFTVRADDTQDCTGNGVPDECEPDCNTNGIPDDCDIADSFSNDCNSNAIPDECDLASGASQDCNDNDVPDECEADCNTNGLDDACDIAAGTSEDCNANDVPDECESDCNGNGVPDDCDLANGTTLPCAVIEFAPGGSTGPFQIDGNEMVIPAGNVQVEFEILVSGWGNAPRSPLLGGFNMVLDGQSLLGSNAVPSNPGVDLSTPLAIECGAATECPKPSPPGPVTQTGMCGIIFSGWCDDFNPAFFMPRVCSDDPRKPCSYDSHCPVGVVCVDNPRFVFPSDLAPLLSLSYLGSNSFQWIGFPQVPGGAREDPDGVTRFLAANLRLIVPEDARGTYTIRLDPGLGFTFLIEPLAVVIPAEIIHGQLTIGGACCMADGSCEILREGECAEVDGTHVGGTCPNEGDPCIRDCDGNGIDDVDEFAALADCLAGPGRTPDPRVPECTATCLAAFDADHDEDVDLNDFRVFQAAFTGPQ